MTSISLLELNAQIKQSVQLRFGEPLWVRAEIGEIHENANGHCYLEFIEKEEHTDRMIARLKGMIWSFTYRMLKPYFESATLNTLQQGMQVLVQVKVEFHEVYGMSLNVVDIDPSYTVGDMARRRAEIIQQLTDEGIMDMNKQLPMPLLPQRIAVISSATAAGYGDFCNQLKNNPFGYPFYVKLFPAVMQGVNTESSVIEALDKINGVIEYFDAVVMIRGGGSTTDLAAFDNYNMALNCTQFPLPIISGIGHDRDQTILDMVAHTCVKTPTAAAEFLIDRIHGSELSLNEMVKSITQDTRYLLNEEQMVLQRLFMHLPHQVNRRIHEENQILLGLKKNMMHQTKQCLVKAKNGLELIQTKITYASPEQVLRRGFTLTQQNGEIIKSSKEINENEMIETIFYDGSIQSFIQKNQSES